MGDGSPVVSQAVAGMEIWHMRTSERQPGFACWLAQDTSPYQAVAPEGMAQYHSKQVAAVRCQGGPGAGWSHASHDMCTHH